MKVLIHISFLICTGIILSIPPTIFGTITKENVIKDTGERFVYPKSE